VLTKVFQVLPDKANNTCPHAQWVSQCFWFVDFLPVSLHTNVVLGPLNCE